MKGLILCCSSNTRMQPFTKTCAKQLLPILNKPNLIYTIEMFQKSDIKDLVIIAGDTYQQLQRLLGNGERWGVNIVYQFYNQLHDSAYGIKGAQSIIQEEDFALALGNYFIDIDVKEMIEEHYKNNYSITALLLKHEKTQGSLSHLANAGLFIFNGKKIYQAIEALDSETGTEPKLREVIQEVLGTGGSLGYYLTNDRFILDTPTDLMRVNQIILRRTPTSNKGIVDSVSTILGDVIIEEGARIFNSILQGPLFIGRDTLILNSFIGVDACIGERCEIVDASIDKSLVFSDTNIYHLKEPISNHLIGYSSILDLTSYAEVSISNIKGRGI